MKKGSKRVIPGFGLSLGVTLSVLSIVVLIPLASLVVYTAKLSPAEFWETITRPRVLASFRVSLLTAFAASAINAVTVDGDSMRETLHDKDRLLMSDLLYTPEYGDIVIVNNTHSYLYDEDGNLVEGNGLPQEKRLIKRIIATGGQEINIDFATGEVTVDGEVLDEPYIRELTANQEDGFASYPVTVPEGYYFVMGDNRNNSTDSRSQFVGFVPRDAILGKAIFRISPDDFGSIYKNMK